jgi:acetylornithine deacetylase/succinyl-diaminopimelate desuccinylase-like protein
MIRIPSENPPGNETEISIYVSELLTSLGFDVEQVESKPNRVNTLGVLKASERARQARSQGQDLGKHPRQRQVCPQQ